MKKSLLFGFFVALFFSAWAQERTVSGKVTSAEDGSPLPGVNVVLKGTSTGTVTDISGGYKLSVPESGGTLVFSFIGLVTQEIEIAGRSTIDVSMAQDVQQLTEVVVTALGSNKSEREIVYANQTVTNKDLLTTPSKNALEALRGKTAGVKLTTGSGSVGASTRIVLRGEASLTGDNNALIVVDGVPIDNSSSFGGLREGEGGYADYGNRFNDFDPENIESVTILKGPAATSLYGSRGASGVVVITTKSGSRDQFSVNVSSTSSFEQAYVLLQRQDKYGQGLINPDGSNTRDSGENFSWGPPVDGIVRPWTSPIDIDGDGTYEYLSRPYSAVKDQLQNFFRTGYTLNNSISFSGGSDRYKYYASYSNTLQNGILDNTDYERHSINLNASAKLSDKFNSRLTLNYSNVDQNTTQEGSRAFEGQNPYASAVQAAITIPYTELRDYKNPYHSFEGYYGSYTVNPYFILNEYVNNGRSNNFLASFALDYNPIKDLTLSTSIGTNYVGFNRISAVPVYAYADHYIWEDNLTLTKRGDRQSSEGSYEELLSTSETIDWTTKGSYRLNFMEKLSVTPTIGVNYYDVRKRQLTGATQGGLAIPGIYNLGNSKDRASVTQNHFARRIIGAFGNIGFAWDNKIFVEYSARNDWSSTLPENSQSFFYQSIGANTIVSDYLGLESNKVINYFKFRASYGTTGKDASPYLLSSLFVNNPTLVEYRDIYLINTPLDGQPGASRDGLIGNSSLKPELTKTLEVGGDFGFFSNKIQLTYTYYKSNHTQQIVIAELPRSSGFTSTPVNIGEIQNTGHELAVTAVPIELANGLRWTLNLTWSKNTSLVKKISDDTDELTIWNSGRGVTLVAKEGQPFGTWKGQVARYTDEGQPIVDENGSQTYTTDAQIISSIQPDWIGGLTSTLEYKGFRFGFVLDTRQGGQIFSLTKAATEFNGTSVTTTINDRKPFIIPNSVVENEDGTFSPNTKKVAVDVYVDDGNYSRHLLDASFIKLREITLGYSFPRSILSPLKIKQASINLFVKNPKTWLPGENKFADPEVNGPVSSTSNATGVESTQTPVSKSYGVNLNITF